MVSRAAEHQRRCGASGCRRHSGDGVVVWVKSSDDFMLDERVQAIDCQADCTLRAAYEVCNRIDTDGIFYAANS